jgi:hypothetical protein
MNWDEDRFRLYQKAYRPKPHEAIGRGRRFRDPEEQAEVDRRVEVYAKEVELLGRITRWLPRRGSGGSATVMG